MKPEHVAPYKEAVYVASLTAGAPCRTKWMPSTATLRNTWAAGKSLLAIWAISVRALSDTDHIWRYTGYQGFDTVSRQLRSDPLLVAHEARIAPMLQHRRNWLTQAFTFWQNHIDWATSDSVYELRTYQLQPGHLLEWERIWCVMATDKQAPRSRGASSLYRAARCMVLALGRTASRVSPVEV